MALSKRSNASNVNHNITLHKASASGNLRAIEKLLASEVDIDSVDTSGNTALMAAAESAYRDSKKHLEVIQFLIAQGADPNIINRYYNSTALDIAVAKCCPEVIKLLYPITKIINIRHFGYLPDPNDHNDGWDFSTWLQTVTVLKSFGVNFNEVWSSENLDSTLLKFFCLGDSGLSTDTAYRAMDFILSHTANQDFASCERHILETLILHIKDKTIFKMYLSKLVNAGLKNIDAKDSYQQTALHWAAIKDHLVAVEVLVEFGANVNNTQKNNLTPLHFAAAGHAKITKFLLKSGANPKMLDDQLRDPIQYSKDECISQQKCYSFSKPQYLEEFKARYSDAQIAITEHQENISKALRSNSLLKANGEESGTGSRIAKEFVSKLEGKPLGKR